MKKLLVVLLALTAVSAMAFADDVAWTYGLTVKTGAQLTLGDKDSVGDTQLVPNDADSPSTSRIRFDADAALGDFSAHARINTDSAGAVAPTFSAWWVNAYFLNKMVQMQFGNLDHSVTDTVNKGWGGLNVEGAQVVVVPVEGASVGLAIPVNLGTTLSKNGAGMKVGVSYTMPNLAIIKATYSNAPGDKLSDIAAGVEIDAVPNLKAQFEVQDTDLGSKITVLSDTFGFKSGGIELFEYASYALGALTPSLEMWQVLPADSDLDMSLYVKPGIDYVVMEGTAVGASVKYTMKPYLGAVDVDSALAIDPYVKFTFNAKASLKIDAAYTIPDLSETSTWNMPINFNFIFSY